MNSTKLISIITPCYNSEQLIDFTIQSVLDQSYCNWELILVNDGSSDNTRSIIESYAQNDDRIIVFHMETNQGIAAARNVGIKLASGNFICFLDSDDIWDSRKLQRQLSFMEENNYFFSHTAYRKIDRTGHIISKIISVSNYVDYNSLLKHNEIGCLTAMYNVDVLGKYYFKNIGHEDFACWLQILKNNRQSYGLNEPLAFYRVHSNTVSSNKLKVVKYTWHIYRTIEELSLFKSGYYFVHYVINSFIKYLR